MSPSTTHTLRLLALIALAVSACSLSEPLSETPQPGLSRLPEVLLPAKTSEFAAAVESNGHPYLTTDRLEQGYTIVAVGVNGDNLLSAGLAEGIVESGYEGAVEVVDWTTGHWPLFVYHLRSDARHDRGAAAITQRVAAYRRCYPGRPCNLVAYSAGAAVVLEALEELPEGADVERAVLVAAAVSPAHDLQSALSRCRVGMWNYYQPQDVVALWAGTLLAGTADGHHLMSAGAVGFWPPGNQHRAARAQFDTKLVQLPYEPEMALAGNLGGHFQCVNRRFIAEWIAPILDSPQAVQVARRPVSSTAATLR